MIMAAKPKENKNCPEDCVYNIHGKNYTGSRWGFLTCIIVLSAICGAFFISYNNSYKETHLQIIKAHEQFCNTYTQSQASDSTVVYQDLRPLLDSYKQSMSESLALQYDKIQNEYAILTIWASALMIIFLIFSIYSMYKIDEIQKQGRESLYLIDETYSEVRKKSDNLDSIVSEATQRVQKTIDTKIDEFSSKISSQSKKVEDEIKEYEDNVREAAKRNKQLFDSFSLLLRSITPEDKSKNSDSNK